MFMVRPVLATVAFALFATVSSVSAQSDVQSARPGAAAMAQAEKPVAKKHWTRTRLDAAKKRWAQNQQRFYDCSNQLDEAKKQKRMSLHRQGHFLEECMKRSRT
jgi:hypothetical protein